MKTSEEINKAFDKKKNPFYPRCNVVETDGYCRGERATMCELALPKKTYCDSGLTCPHCGSRHVDPNNYESRVDFMNFCTAVPSEPTLSVECKCEDCGKDWRIIYKVKPDVVFYQK